MVARRTTLLLATLLLSACDLSGDAPPLGRISFPAGLAVSPSGDHLFVVSSNFDLRYNSGALHTYDADLLIAKLDELCGPLTATGREDCGVLPVEDARTDLSNVSIEQLEGLLLSEVLVGSYVDGVALTPRADGGMRLFLPIRSDANLTWVDVNDAGQLDCGEGFFGPDGRTRCLDDHRRADESVGNDRSESLPTDPVAVSVGQLADIRAGVDGRYVLLAHRGGSVSLFLDDDATGPRYLDSFVSGAEELVDVAVQPRTGNAWITSARDRLVDRVGVAVDESDPTRSFLAAAGSLTLGDVDTGSLTFGDTRVVRFDPRADVDRAYVLGRRPRGLYIVDTNDTAAGELPVRDIIPVGLGPSRLDVVDFPAEGRTLAFASCYDDRSVWIVDVDSGELVGIGRNVGGAFELAVRQDPDTGRSHLLIADFRSSVIRVLDLAPMFECLTDRDFAAPGDEARECAPELLGFLGRPTPISELL